jgi:hypothetical protein
MATPEPHLLIVRFDDNDFAKQVMKACEDLLESFALSDTMSLTLSRFQSAYACTGAHTLARSIAMGAWGHYLAEKAGRYLRMHVRLETQEELSQDFDRDEFESTLNYLLKKIRVEFVARDFETGWENGGVCYVDFESCEVHLQ